MAQSYDLTRLDTNSFEHLVNFLAMRVLGAGTTGFGPGSDGGRDGFFEGEAPYPSVTERWSGRWYIQSKFMKPHLGKDPQKWLCQQIRAEISEFKKPHSPRKVPDIWIVASNIDPSGVPETGAFDEAQTIVENAFGKGKVKFHIWGGRKILDFLANHPSAATYYGHFLTPGHVLKAIYDQIGDLYAETKTIVEYLVVNQFNEHQYTKLDQAGSSADTRPKIHDLFIDLPFSVSSASTSGFITKYLNKAAAQNHRSDDSALCTEAWRAWRSHPSRARIWILKGGPGQGKSTIGQYFAQVQRAALILTEDGPRVIPRVRATALEVKTAAENGGFWPTVPRIPVLIELKDFAKWYGEQKAENPRGILTYLSKRIAEKIEQQVLPGTLKRALQHHSWFFTFDGLDEVPNDVKDKVAKEITIFINEQVTTLDADVLTLCTSRPQGYSGQFSSLDGPVAELVELSPETALSCAEPVVRLDRSKDEGDRAMELLRTAIESKSVRELMTTPLQSHIMAVVVRDGGRPPERRWHLFDNFYQVMKKRESLKNFPDPRVSKLLREDEQLLKAIHSRLGFVLHSRAESMEGAHSTLERSEFKTLVQQTVSQLIDEDVSTTVDVLMEATTERLVFVNTPESGATVRFDIRQLQEFFAAEFLYEGVDAETLRSRIELVAGDAHWLEVMHFLLSALVENGRTTELTVVIDTLNRLNEGTDDDKSRLFHRRMARGSLLAARLLHEGVLEQDKRVRQRFRSILEPINGLLEPKKLLGLSQIGHQNSKSWLVNWMFDALRESSRAENIAAAITLARILEDGDPRVSELKHYLSSSPSEYLETVLQCIAESEPDREDDEAVSFIQNTWFYEFLLQLLVGTSWTSLTASSAGSIVSILGQIREKLEHAARALGIGDRDRQLANLLLEGGDSESDEQVHKDYGMIHLTAPAHDWTTKTVPSDWKAIDLESPSTAPGALHLILAAIRFAVKRDWAEFSAMVEALQRSSHIASKLYSRQILNFIPTYNWFEGLPEIVRRLSALDQIQFDSLLGEGIIGGKHFSRPISSMRFLRSGGLGEWPAFVRDFPDLSVSVWFDDIGDLSPVEMNRAGEEIIKVVDRRPEVFAASILSWGKLFSVSQTEAARIREVLVSFVRTNKLCGGGTRWLYEIVPFEINLNTEAELLPLLTENLVDQLPILVGEDFSFPHAREKKESISAVLDAFGLTLNELGRTAKAPDLPPEIRAAALSCLLIAQSSSKLPPAKITAYLTEWRPLIISLYSPTVAPWFLKGVAFFYKNQLTELQREAVLLLSELSEIARDDFGARLTIERIFEDWRERSHAPVQTRNVLNRWLEQ